MKNGKRAVSFILAVVLLCTSFAGCGMVQQDKAYLEQVAAAVTETQSILKDVEAAADELSGQSSIVYENSVNAEGFDVLDEYYTLCTEKLNALNDAVGAVRRQMQSLERCDAPKTEKGKAVEAEQKAYFEDALEVIGGIQEALTFYTAQYDALQPLVTATVGDRSDEQAYLISVYEAAGNVKTALSTLDTPEWLNDLWPKYVANLDVMTKYMESRSWGLAWSDVLRLYSANQLISRVGITSGRHEETMFDLYSREYNHAAFCSMRTSARMRMRFWRPARAAKMLARMTRRRRSCSRTTRPWRRFFRICTPRWTRRSTCFYIRTRATPT